jgi:hypothetical protein
MNNSFKIHVIFKDILEMIIPFFGILQCILPCNTIKVYAMCHETGESLVFTLTLGTPSLTRNDSRIYIYIFGF